MEINAMKTADGVKELAPPPSAKQGRLAKLASTPAGKVGLVVFCLIAVVVCALCRKTLASSKTTTPERGTDRYNTSIPHEPIRYYIYTVRREFGETIKINCDKGEKFVIATAGPDVEVEEKINGDKVFPMFFTLREDSTNYVLRAQVDSLSLRAANERSYGKSLVYCICDYGYEPPEDWRLECLRRWRNVRN